MLEVQNRGDLRDGADEVICPPRCRALVWICVNFRDHFQFFFFPLSFMEGVLSFNTTTPHSITCLLQLISTLDFVLIRKALAI